MSLSRYADILEAQGVVPFQREPWVNPRTGRVEPQVLGERLPMRWRVSRDEWDRLWAWAKREHGWTSSDQPPTELGGWPIAPDDSLPTGSVIFEPQP